MSVKVSIGEPLRKGFSFAFSPRRFIQFFVVDIFFIMIIYLLVISNYINLSAIFISGTLSAEEIYFFAALMGWYLLRIFVKGSLIHQSYRPKDSVKRSFNVSSKKYIPLLLAYILISLISGLSGYIPVFGFILNLFATLALFFLYQIVIVDNRNFSDAVRKSVRIFMATLGEFKERSRFFSVLSGIYAVLAFLIFYFLNMTTYDILLSLLSALSVFFILSSLTYLAIYSRIFWLWLAVTVVSMLILVTLLIPAFVILIAVIFISAGTAAGNIMDVILSMGPMLVIPLVIFALSLSISSTFSVNVKTRYYTKLKRIR